ncbi:MAG: phosphate acyltransferase PlsX [Clostridia bacterium]|nr:phosphate acyltransferase PlsX [Clostridia bacterium]
MKIILDAFGGDNAPQVPVNAAFTAAKKLDTEIILVGDEKLLNEYIHSKGYSDDRVHIVHASEVISNSEAPASAVRTKKDSSIAVAAGLLKDGRGDALVSAGSTGAVLTAALTIVGRIRGVRRPALASVLPSASGGTLLLDCGANIDCRSEDLYNFAIMGNIYMKKIMKIENPKVALLSNGEEEGKGNQLVKEAYELLSEAQNINFTGNCEGRDIMLDGADVVVCDGFVGNVALKSVEGTAKMLSGYLKSMLLASVKTKISAALMSGELKEFKRTFDYREYGGAPLLGIKRPVIKAHGASDERSMFLALAQAQKWVNGNVNDEIAELLGKKSNN